MTEAFQALLCAARDGDKEAAGELLERYRTPLQSTAAAALPKELQAKLSASDLVQQTFLDAQRRISSFQGESPEMLAAWLRTTLANKVHDELRRFKTPARAAAVEV